MKKGKFLCLSCIGISYTSLIFIGRLDDLGVVTALLLWWKNRRKALKASPPSEADETAVMLAPAQVINIISWDKSDDNDFVKIVSETGDVLYADPTHLRALPKKSTEK